MLRGRSSNSGPPQLFHTCTRYHLAYLHWLVLWCTHMLQLKAQFKPGHKEELAVCVEIIEMAPGVHLVEFSRRKVFLSASVSFDPIAGTTHDILHCL